MDDEALVISWTAAFHREASGDKPPPMYREQCLNNLQEGRTYLWENKIPVCMANSTRPTQNGINIGDVYTPPEYRNRGYATSCVAALCRELLRDFRFIVLFTDISNPVPNSIYKRIGFEPYSDAAQYTFE
jgi:hypothetical protein